MATEELFGNYKSCSFCGRTLPKNYEGDLCPNCQKAQLFREVKEYIRANDVNAYDVAEHFHISLHQVKEWIREGRIEYRENPSAKIEELHCQRCGAPISFGTLCSKCLKHVNSGKGTSVGSGYETDERMHYLDIRKK